MARGKTVHMGKPPVRMTETTCLTLAALADHPGYLTELGRRIERPCGTVNHALYRMLKAGWLKSAYEKNPSDENRVVLMYRVTEKGLIAADVARKTLSRPTVDVTVPWPKRTEKFYRYPVQLEKDPADPKWIKELKDGLPSDVLMADPCCLEFGPCRNCERPVWRVVGKPAWTHFLHAADPYHSEEYPKPCQSPQTARGVKMEEVL